MSTLFDIIPNDWFRRFFPRSLADLFPSERDFSDIFRDIYSIRNEIERSFSEQLKAMQSKVPKDLVREYETPEGSKVREMGPLVYGYTMGIGRNGRPQIREFGNIRSPLNFCHQPAILAEREPLVQIDTTDKEVKITVEMPGVSKEKIRINTYDKYVEIKSEDPNRKYYKTIEVPQDIDIESGKSKYNNGILEIIFKKTEQSKKRKNINIE